MVVPGGGLFLMCEVPLYQMNEHQKQEQRAYDATINPQPLTLNPQPSTLNPEAWSILLSSLLISSLELSDTKTYGP